MMLNNWLEWSYDDISFSPPSTEKSKFNLKLNSVKNLVIKSYYDELLNNASKIRDSFREPINLFFSGGINSQIILRSYLDLKIPINVYIIKFNNDINLVDVTTAINICQSLNVRYQTIDFDLKSFFEKDAESIYDRCFSLDPTKLILLKSTENINGVSIFGTGEFYFISDNDTWRLKLTEENFKISTALERFNRPIVSNWFYYSPELLLSFINHPKVNQLLNNEILGKESSLSIRGTLHKEFWKNFVDRKKMIGFENCEKYLLPEYILEFYKKKTVNCNNKYVCYLSKEEIRKIYLI